MASILVFLRMVMARLLTQDWEWWSLLWRIFRCSGSSTLSTEQDGGKRRQAGKQRPRSRQRAGRRDPCRGYRGSSHQSFDGQAPSLIPSHGINLVQMIFNIAEAGCAS